MSKEETCKFLFLCDLDKNEKIFQDAETAPKYTLEELTPLLVQNEQNSDPLNDIMEIIAVELQKTLKQPAQFTLAVHSEQGSVVDSTTTREERRRMAPYLLSSFIGIPAGEFAIPNSQFINYLIRITDHFQRVEIEKQMAETKTKKPQKLSLVEKNKFH